MFSVLENLYYLPLIRHGLTCQMVDILHLMCSSLWNISLVLELHFHWILGIFVILEHVIYHVYASHYVTFLGRNLKLQIMIISLNIGLISFHLIDFMMNCE